MYKKSPEEEGRDAGMLTIGFIIFSLLLSGVFWILKVEGGLGRMIGTAFNSFFVGLAVGLVGLYRDDEKRVRFSELSSFAAISAPYLLATVSAGALGTATEWIGREEAEIVQVRPVPASEYWRIQESIASFSWLPVILGAVTVYLWLRWRRSKPDEREISVFKLNLDGWGVLILAMILNRFAFAF